MNTFGIYKKNQLLFLEAGFIHLNSILSGLFVPFYGISFIFVSVATYFIYCFMGSIMNQFENEFEDFHNVISSSSFPSAGKNILVSIFLILITTPIILFYNQDYIHNPYNSAFCTLFSLLLGGAAFVLATRNTNSFVPIMSFTIISIPMVFISLIIGGVLSLPLSFIYFYRRVQSAD